MQTTFDRSVWELSVWVFRVRCCAPVVTGRRKGDEGGRGGARGDVGRGRKLVVEREREKAREAESGGFGRHVNTEGGSEEEK